jgi:Concanavalin A-like lectin/glucanases superfamily
MRRKFGVYVVSVLVSLGVSEAASAATLKADYRFQGTLASSVAGAPSLADIGPGTNAFQTDNVLGSSQQVLRFPQGNGVSVASTNSIIPNGSYSIVMLFRLDKTDGYNRLVDFANGTSDNGLYDQSGQLVLYPDTSGSSASQITPGTYFQVAITRDASGAVVGYVNGSRVLGPYDDSSTNDALITADNVLRFFIDDMAVPNEDSAGAVARIRIWDGPLTPAEVAALGPAPPPVVGKAVDASVLSGTVLIKQGSRFVPLTGAQQIPVGAELDTRAGTVSITAASGTGHATYNGHFKGAVFKITQSRNGAQRGVTTLSLLEAGLPSAPSFASCRHGSHHVLQTLHSSDRGHFRSRGHYAAATVRGTIWDTTDRCDGTLIAVKRGSVIVTDFRRHKNVTLTAGHSYFAKAP